MILLIMSIICATLAVILLLIVAYRENKILKLEKEKHDREIKILRRKARMDY